jgi:hypothetical protein
MDYNYLRAVPVPLPYLCLFYKRSDPLSISESAIQPRERGYCTFLGHGIRDNREKFNR